MAFILAQFGPLGGQSRPTKSTPPGAAGVGAPAEWGYGHAADNLAAIKATGYFNEVRGLLSPGDSIKFSANGAAVDIVTVNAVPAPGTDVTIHTADINSA